MHWHSHGKEQGSGHSESDSAHGQKLTLISAAFCTFALLHLLLHLHFVNTCSELHLNVF